MSIARHLLWSTGNSVKMSEFSFSLISFLNTSILNTSALTLSHGKAALRGEVGECKKEKEASCCHQSHMLGGQPWQLGTICIIHDLNFLTMLMGDDNLHAGATYLLVA